ncbi:hypothetical protein KDA_01610 [Dictyobacter alpinus]|uniref:histidine kinase n=1 Tax=Dictyobacter alpinus TaxID=2014873 RepID=A0A402B036_9CHLR|nr:HAMP domain-containing sensor histidine kinase [Dictyobacter alpinus]GCE24677.1 hypothetical protein KDA_01610 [Dictyobacter alpinus]
MATEPPKIKERLQYIKNKLQGPTWLRSPLMGYIAAFLLVGFLLLIEKADEGIPDVPLFIGTPFGLLAILVALVWGTGPALVALGFGLIVVIEFISPNTLTTDIPRDVLIIGPFIALQLTAIATVVRLEQAHLKLKRSQQQLEQANALKTYVLVRAAHELKTPLTTIIGRTQWLSSHLDRSGPTPENWAALQRYLEVTRKRAYYLQELIDSLFDLSRAYVQGAAALQLSPCDLVTICRDAVEDVQALSDRSIDLDCPPSPLLLQADEKYLAQVLINLLNNAVKYSPENSKVKVHVHSEDNSFLLQVHNDSPTLSQEQLERLFEPFYRDPVVERAGLPGWGLGLTISKQFVELHGGQLWAELYADNGITFLVRLPADPNGPIL